ncbi:hypothetical protein CC86DRAFT_308748 [Ophiobolus disseminans]|uniref:Uncharacterized protein n=1 Tax=Ophiobolus disseminans TaxID=1469910 RepID=A0A6A6ZCB4_9PLEO|nr:hypothetical protein CC86DRAFT_308748 [Ophiobolus disseminans]
MTSSTLDKRGWPSKLLAVDVRTGGPKQHVGILRKGRLYWAVYSCLQLIGHQGNGRDKGHTGREREVCHQNMAQYCQQNCVVPNIVYDFGSGTYATNAHLKEKNHAGIREVVYQFAANIYRMQLEELENCYYTDFADSRKTLMCNVLRNLIIVWPTRSGADIAARLNINVEFNGKTTNGKYYCEKNLPAYTKYFKENTKDKISKAMNWKSDKIFLFNSCQEDACFDTRERYTLGAPWVEPKGCSPPSNSVL